MGKIESGMLADAVVLERDPFTAPVNTLHEVTVAMTLIEGEVVYQRTE